MTVHDRLSAVLDRLATGSRVAKIREAEKVRAEHHGDATIRNERLDEAITRLEAVADELWSAIETKPQLKKVS